MKSEPSGRAGAYLIIGALYALAAVCDLASRWPP